MNNTPTPIVNDFMIPENTAPPVVLDRLVRPGERLLISITFPEELDESESCHPDIVLEDFLESRNDGSWRVEIHSILPNAIGEARADTAAPLPPTTL
jgi:hypothetical protein